MSTSTWKNAVLGIQRMPFGTCGGRVSDGPSHGGCLDRELGPEQRDAVVVVGDHHVADAVPLLGRQRVPLVDVAEDADPASSRRPARPSKSTCSFHLLKCGVPIQIAWSMPVSTRPLRALVDERVLARPRAEALAEQHELRPVRLGDAVEPLVQRVEQHPGLLPPLVHPVEREDRRARRVLHRDGRTVAAGQQLERGHRGVVHVTGAGRRGDAAATRARTRRCARGRPARARPALPRCPRRASPT